MRKRQETVRKNETIIILLVFLLVVFAILIAANQEIQKCVIQAFSGKMQNLEENEKVEVYEDGSAVLTDDAAIISSASVVGRTTGTAPFDSNDEPGNDSSADNDVVRSFDKITWNIEANMAINNTGHGSEEASKYNSFRGGIIYVEASLPEEYAGLMKWSLEDMAWAEGTGAVSENGLIFTAQYQMSENNITVPGKQSISMVLSVLGAGNQTQINPNFKLWMQGNESNKGNEGYEAIEIQDNFGAIMVSAKGGYNIKIANNSFCTIKTNVDFGDGKGEITGRMYGYGVILQLYGDNKEKGLKGIEAPKGDIHFDVNMKLEMVETIDGKQVTTDITEQAMPQLWNYKINIGDANENPSYGNIPDRNMYFGGNTAWSTGYAPYGMAQTNRTNSIYDSGNIKMEQEGNTIKTTINDYAFDGIFPIYNHWYNPTNPSIVYNDNVGCFSAGYFQVFVPDNEITSNNDKTYNLTIEDSNMQIVTSSGEMVTEQKVTTDDSYKQQHYYIKPASYSRSILLYDDDRVWMMNHDSDAGYYARGRKSKGQMFQARIGFDNSSTNDMGTEIKSVNELIKFDGDGLEPILQTNGSPFIIGQGNITEYNIYYLTKKDGTNWRNQEERNNANIEDFNIYHTLEEIPQGYICTGIYIEANIGTSIAKTSAIFIRMKIKDTAEIGKTYGIVHDTDYYTETLDLKTQTITNPEAIYPKKAYSQHNATYKNIEYDENGEVITGTHNGGGNSLLVAGADSSISTKVIDEETGEEKEIFDLAKNEDIVTFKVEPKLEELDENNPARVTGATITIKDTLSKGLTYVPGSSNYGEPIETTENEDGTTTVVFEKYNCNVGETIEPLTFKAQIDPASINETTLTHTAVIEPDREKIGLTEISYRTATNEIKVVNLTSHRIYQETDTQIIENDGEIKYKVTYENKTATSTPDFQLLDILPYNGDGRGTAYNGTYILENVKVTQTGTDGEIPTDNLSLYTTTDIDARSITPKDESIGVTTEEGGIWQEKEIGQTINEPVTVLALKGEIEPSTKIEMEITIKTNNNRAGDMYANTVTAQTSKDTEVITTGTIETRVVRRQISGMIWYDTNENGLKDGDEAYANRIEVELKKADGSKAVDISGNEILNLLTNENGEYVFSNLPIGEYIVEIHTEDKYTLTEVNVGTNKEINSKFEEGENGAKQSYVITNLNSIVSPEILENNVNAGLVVKDAKIIVKYLEEDSTPETDEDNRVIKEQEEITTYEKDGGQVKYKLGDNYTTEAAKIEDYVVLRNSENTTGTLDKEEIVVTYYYAYNKQDIEVTKVWEDNGNQAGKRPTSIKVTLKDGNNTVKESILSDASEMTDKEKEDIEGISNTAEVWKTTIEDVAIYDENGQKINYVVDESENEGSLDSYIKTVEGTRITNTFTQNTERIDISVTKVWDDRENKAGKRPQNVTLILKRKVDVNTYVEVARATINGIDNKGINSNEWAYTFANIAKYNENNDEIIYVVEEIVPEFYTSKVEKVENTEGKEGTTEFTITNKFEVPNETISVEVSKVWNDNNNRARKRPEEVTLVLTGNGQEFKISLNQSNQVEGQENIWKGTIENLPKYDENADVINYELSEESLDSIYYTEENTTINQLTKTVTNKFEVPDDKIEIEVNKKWEDDNNALGRRPENVTLYLTGNNQEYEITLTKVNAIDGTTSDEQDTSTIWRGTIGNLPKYDVNGNEITYTVDERPIASEFYTKTGIDQGSKTITNTFAIPTESIQIPVAKIWEDNNNSKGCRPENIVLQIKEKITGKVVAEQMVSGNKTTNNGWNYTFEIPKYNNQGQIVEYEIGEKELENKFYPSANTKIDQEQRTITNVFVVPDEKIELTVNKVWVDNEIQASRRPETIVINVKATNGDNNNPEEVIATYELNTQTETSYKFTNLPKYNGEGDEVVYTVEEIEKNIGDLKFYTSKVDGTTITNTFTIPQGTTSITITKKWEDEDNKYKKRPKSIEVEIKNGEQVVQEGSITEGENWQHTFTGLEKYDGNGREIQYSVDEKDLTGEAQIYYTKNIQGTTITNTMTKTPGTVTVKYVDKYTNEEISDKVEKEGVVGEGYSVEEDKKEIAGYTLIEEPEEKEGVFTNEPQEKIYYYAKNSEVIVKYLEKDETESNTDNKVVAEEIRIEGYEGKEYKAEEKKVPDYTFVEVSGETEGTMTSKDIEVIYYYAPNTQVTVKYIEQDNTPNNNSDNTVLDTVVIDGYVGKKYQTEEKEIPGYTFIKTSDNTEGTMTKEEIEVYYYYAQNTKVTVKYVEQDKTPDNNNDNTVLDTVVIEGYEGKSYITEAKEIEGYTFVEASDNTEGTMTKGEIEVYYYYAQKTSIKVQYIDKTTGEVLEETIKEGKVGDIYKTEAIPIPGYVLVEEPANTNVEMIKEQQVVKYYYLKQVEGVIEKHVDIISGKILEEKTHIGKVGDPYKIDAKEFEGYDLVENVLPENTEGEMTTEVIEVTYYYIKKASVRVQYLEKGTETVLTEETIIKGHENEDYETKAKEIEGYNLLARPENAIGKMKVSINADGTFNTETVVTYYYIKQAGGVIEKHIDINSGKVLEQEEHTGNVGDSYEIEPKEYEGYDLVIEDEEGNTKLPQNAKGTMTEEAIEVIYYYQKLSVVRVEYIDKYTGEKIAQEKIEGHEGEEYETEGKEFDGYDLIEIPSNNKGEMQGEEIVVKYYYLRKAEVEIQYIEKETGYVIAESEVIKGHEGDSYETIAASIDYYNLIGQTKNTNGNMTKEKITVIYYYKKQTFNLTIDKWISGVSIDGIPQIGQSYESRDKLYKIDIRGNKISTSDVKVTYTIRITNTGEIEGTANKITEIIPKEFYYRAEDNRTVWKEEGGNLVTEALEKVTIRPGESKEIEIVLRWNNGEDNLGEVKNTAIISGVTNPAKYADMIKQDNSDSSQMLITIKTGGLDSRDRSIILIVGVLIEMLLMTGILFGRISKKKIRK